MLQIENSTPFRVQLFLLPNPAGLERVYVVVKATFALRKGEAHVAEEQSPIIPADQYWGEPDMSSVRDAGEAHPTKPASDVILVGSAYAPGGKPSVDFGVSMAVGRIRKAIRVMGDRTWTSGLLGTVPSRPAPVTSVPLRWERAYGGQQDLGEGKVLREPRNPVGCGFKGKRSQEEMYGLPVPNLEDPGAPIKTVSDRPTPMGFGHIAPSWEPRSTLAGTYDEAWEQQRAPFLPDDFDPRFLQSAPLDQIYPGRLQGGEPVELINAAPQGVQRFTLPRCELEAKAHLTDGEEQPPLQLETLLLEPDQDRFAMLWRGEVRCGKRGLGVHLVELRVQRLDGAAA